VKHISPYLKWERLGLSRNPFQTADYETDDLHYVSVPWVESAFSRSDQWLQIMGEKGRGKTTLLRALCGPGLYEWVPEGQHDFATQSTLGRTFFLDEAQRLAQSSWSRLVSHDCRPQRLVFSSHQDLTAVLAGFGIECQTLLIDPLDPDWIGTVLNRRIERYTQICSSIRLSGEAIAELMRLHGSDIRAMEETLYHVFQSLQERTEITLALIQKCSAFGRPEQ
jgi:hypothetical protein